MIIVSYDHPEEKYIEFPKRKETYMNLYSYCVNCDKEYLLKEWIQRKKRRVAQEEKRKSNKTGGAGE